MRYLLLAAVLIIALAGSSQASIGLNLQTYEQCAALLASIASKAEWASSGRWYRAAGKAFALAAAEERIKLRGEVPDSLKIEMEVRAVKKDLAEYFKDDQSISENPELLEFCMDLGKVIASAGQ